MADLTATWLAEAISVTAAAVSDRVLKLPDKQRPRSTKSFTSLLKAAKAVPIFVFDPKDVARDLKAKGLISEELEAEILVLLEDTEPPKNCTAVPPSEWPSEGCYSWTKPGPPKLPAKGLAMWICSQAYARVRPPCESVIKALTGKLFEDSGDGRLKYIAEADNSDKDGFHTVPWTWYIPKFIKPSDLTVQAALLIKLPESCTGFKALQKIREQHDPAYERWMPHMNLIYPFVPLSTLKLEIVQKRFLSFGATAFELCLDDLGQFEAIGNVHLKPNEQSGKELQKIYKCLTDALGFVPKKEAEGGKGKGKGKGTGKGKGKGKDAADGKGKGKGKDAADGKGKGKGEDAADGTEDGAEEKAEEAEEKEGKEEEPAFHPHLTIAKSKEARAKRHRDSESESNSESDSGSQHDRKRIKVDVAELKKSLAGDGDGFKFSFKVTSLSICERGDDTPFREVATLNLADC